MATRLYLAAVVCFGSLVWAGTGDLFSAKADDTKADLQAKVKKLIEQLDNKEFAKREAAKNDLIKLGPDILPYLPESDAKLTPEQINRLTAIRTTLREAVAEKVLTPRLVALQKESIPLTQALAELTKQSGTRVEDMRSDRTTDPTVKLNLEKTTFWQAVDTVARQADL